MESPSHYDAHELKRAMKGLGTDEDTLIEIVASRTNSEIQAIKIAFQEKYQKDLEKEIASETSGDFKKVLISLLQGNRSQNIYPDANQCMSDAQDLFNAGEGKWSAYESVFNKILTQRSHNEIIHIAKNFEQLTGYSLASQIDKEFSGDLKKCLKTLFYCMTNPHEYFASRINQAVKGWGTNDHLLIRVLVTRQEIDMPQIIVAYRQLYGKSMVDDVIDDTSGDYKNILVEIINRHSQ